MINLVSRDVGDRSGIENGNIGFMVSCIVEAQNIIWGARVTLAFSR
jgi:hypothetical protein